MLKTFWMVLDYACNNRCPGCYAEPTGFKMNRMDPNYAKSIIKAMSKSGVKHCLWIGGEPTLYPNLLELIHYATRKGIKSVLVTNGRKLKSVKFVQDLFAMGLDRVTISIEGSNESVHNTVTGVDSFKDTVTGIKNCVDLGFSVGTITTIQKLNQNNCSDILSMLNYMGIRRPVFNCSIPSVGKNGVNVNYALEPDTLADIITKIYGTAKQKGIKVRFNATIPICLIEGSILEEMIKSGSISFGCHMYQGEGVAFDPKGNILPCTHFADFPLISNCEKNGKFAFSQHIGDIWEDPHNTPVKFREMLWRYPVSKCKECRYWGACVGGCPLFWTHYDPKKIISS